jgi:glucan phosphoethanolaminetransferase (alkaline phosphatase superfamily)
MEDNYQKVARNLNTLAILQYVWAGFTFFSAIVVFIIYFVIGAVFTSDNINFNGDEEIAFKFIGGFFFIISIVVLLLLIISSVLKILCGIFMQKRKNRVFCIVIAALECFNIPLGTALGIFTIIELEKQEAKELFGKE